MATRKDCLANLTIKMEHLSLKSHGKDAVPSDFLGHLVWTFLSLKTYGAVMIVKWTDFPILGSMLSKSYRV